MKHIVSLTLLLLITLACNADTTLVQNIIHVPDSLLIKYPVQAKHPFWDNLPTIFTSVISLITGLSALAFAFYNTDKNIQAGKENLRDQLATQLRTTIKKDWNEKVRVYVAQILTKGQMVAIYKDDDEKIVKASFEELISAANSLSLFLDIEETADKALIDAIEAFSAELGKFKELDPEKIAPLTEKVVAAAGKLFNDRN